MNALKYFQSKIEKLSDVDLVMVEGRVHEHWQPHSSLKPCHVINEHLPPWASNSSYCQQCLLERLYDVDLVMTEVGAMSIGNPIAASNPVTSLMNNPHLEQAIDLIANNVFSKFSFRVSNFNYFVLEFTRRRRRRLVWPDWAISLSSCWQTIFGK